MNIKDIESFEKPQNSLRSPLKTPFINEKLEGYSKSSIDYKKYKWFFTSSGKLVVGGKSSLQNDELLKKVKSFRKDFLVMHTSSPGSPFCIILEDIEKLTFQDKAETSIFTGCFSRAWKLMKKTAGIDIFYLSQLYKTSEMKQGT